MPFVGDFYPEPKKFTQFIVKKNVYRIILWQNMLVAGQAKKVIRNDNNKLSQAQSILEVWILRSKVAR